MDRVNRGMASAVGTLLYHLSAVYGRALRGLHATTRRMWVSGLGVFLLVLMVIAGTVSILTPPAQEDRSAAPLFFFSTATPTPAITATPTSTQAPDGSRR
ncbi:MAG: hypothetical protein C4309_06285 [Chloroflexota bacterium]